MKKIRELRIQKGLSFGQVARATKTSPNSIMYYEIGQYTPTDETLMKLAKLYEVDFDEIKTMI